MKMYFVDAFADKIFSGNPAAVCYTSKWLDDEIMQKIAAENNLPETAFIVKENNKYHIRWFTPRYEIDLCGHATLASSFVIKNYIDTEILTIVFTSKSGELIVECKEGLYTLDFPSRPAELINKIKGLEEALGTQIKEYYLSRDLMVVVENEDIVKNLNPNFSKLEELELGDGVIVTAQGKDCDFVSRCFYPKCGVNEDPVTGSAHCNLIPYWAEKLNKDKMYAKQLSERGGDLYCEDKGKRVMISGKAVLYSVADVNL